MDITLGLDFGTHQSKLCLSYMPNNDMIHEFIEFKTLSGDWTTLFPSVIQINSDDTISVGFVDERYCKGILTPKPEKPDCPKEPPVTLPRKPKANYPHKPQTIKLDWKEKLMGLVKGKDKNDVALGKWSRECAEVDSKFKKDLEEWNAECSRIKQEHASWRKEVDEAMADYSAKMASWERDNTHRQYYRYFKISSFSAHYPWMKECLVDADTLSVWYLTYLMLYVKEIVSRNLHEVFEESVSIQMGVPTGVNQSFSRQIKHHAYKLMVAARRLMEHFDSNEGLCNTKYQDLIKMTELPTSNIEETAQDYGFFVIPEAFAGLQSLTNKRRLTRGKMHILVDIGGGTTDMAFFTINEDLTPNVHSVISFHKGLNFVLDEFCKENNGYTISEAQALFVVNRTPFSRCLALYRKELSAQLNNLVNKIKNEFFQQMNGVAKLNMDTLTNAMKGCPIVYCGGGSIYGEMRVKAQYFSDIRLVNKDTMSIPNLKNRSIKDAYYTILATSYGLSVPQFEEPIMKDLSDLFRTIAENAAFGQNVNHSRFEYGITDD